MLCYFSLLINSPFPIGHGPLPVAVLPGPICPLYIEARGLADPKSPPPPPPAPRDLIHRRIPPSEPASDPRAKYGHPFSRSPIKSHRSPYRLMFHPPKPLAGGIATTRTF